MIIGWQEPPHYSLPDNVIGSLGQQCANLAAVGGLILDPWQKFLTEHTCAYTAEVVESRMGDPVHRWAASTVGVMVSRQNGKGSYLEARELAGLFLFGEKVITHSAHEYRTAMAHMDRMIDLIRGHPDFYDQIEAIRRSNGSEGIRLKSGQELRFQTRTKSGGRGLTGDLIVIDEAMYVTPEQMAALQFAISAVPNSQVIYTGSAGTSESAMFGSVRQRGMDLAEYDPRLFWAEWSIDPHSGLCLPSCREHDDPSTEEAVAKANPGYGIRLRADTVEEERKTFKLAPHIFLRERMGVGEWPTEAGQWLVIGKEVWFDIKNRFSSIVSDKIVLGVHMSTGTTPYTTIVACGRNSVGDEHVEITGRGTILDHRPGYQWVVPEIVRMMDEWPDIDSVVIHKSGQAGVLIEELEFFGIKVISPTGQEFAQWCGDFSSAVVPTVNSSPTLAHLGQPPLNSAVAAGVKKNVGNLWIWDQSMSNAQISPLYAATLALGGFRKIISEKPKVAPWALWR